MVSMKKLWEAQQREWPNSVRVSPQAMLYWACAPEDIRTRERRMMSLAMTIQFDKVLFYVTDPNGGYIGARYGVEDYEYQSGFSECSTVRVVDSKIVE